jgi:hypothetical protein
VNQWIRIGWNEGRFIVGCRQGEAGRNNKVQIGILKRFNDPAAAIDYAAAVIDGMKIMSEGMFQPTDFGDVAVTTEAAEKIAAIAQKWGVKI